MKQHNALALGSIGVALWLIGSCSLSDPARGPVSDVPAAGAPGDGVGGRSLGDDPNDASDGGASGSGGLTASSGGVSDVNPGNPSGNEGGTGGAGGESATCQGLACRITDCAAQGLAPTRITGTVYAPNGVLALAGADVYVPSFTPPAFSPTVSCDRCAAGLPGKPIVAKRSEATGYFSLAGVPDGDDVPIVISIGKWRRQLRLPHVGACAETQLDAADTTLPKSMTDVTAATVSVDMPRIAISTGSADALECLVRKLGIADKEISTDTQAGRVHLYTNLSAGEGVSKFAAGFAGGSGNFADSQLLWGSGVGDEGKLGNYDFVMLSCEGAQNGATKPQQALDHLKAYADAGGRVFLSHWQNIWIEGDTKSGSGTSSAVWPEVANWSNGGATLPDGTTASIDEVHDHDGTMLADWMVAVAASPTRGAFALTDGTGRSTCESVDLDKVEQTVTYQNGLEDVPQVFRFTTPYEDAPALRCGQVLFSDLHLSGDSSSPAGGSYPTSCAGSPLTAQETALAFMFFASSSCVGPE